MSFSRQAMKSAFRQELVDRALTHEEFAVVREPGVMAFGACGDDRFEWNLAASNGEGAGVANNENTVRWTGRLAWNPSGAFGYAEGDIDPDGHGLLSTLGLDYSFVSEHLDATGALDDRDVGTAGVDAAVRWRGLYPTGEFFSRDTNPDAPAGDFRDTDFFAQAGYFVVPGRVDVALRFAEASFDEAAPSANGAGADVEKVRDATAGGGWYFDQHDLKVQGDVTRRTTEAFTGGDLGDRILRVRRP